MNLEIYFTFFFTQFLNIYVITFDIVLIRATNRVEKQRP